MNSDIERNILFESESVSAATRRLNEGVGGILVLVDDAEVVTCILTDGDLRRAMLSGANLNDRVSTVMNRRFTTVPYSMPRQEMLKRLSATIRHLPVLDDRGRLVDLISWNKIWRVPISQPSLGGNELKYVADCIETMWVSSQGAYVTRFEEAVGDFVGRRYAISTTSGTTALHLALVALDVGPGDEVIVPALTFGASANAVLHAGATPVFVDIDPVTKTIDPTACDAAVTHRTKAIMPVHLYGHPCDMDELMGLARHRGLRVVEDCAESLGARYRGRRTGTHGDVACFSFFANKVITTGEGGMALTDDADLHARMTLLRDHGMTKERRYWHVLPGFNYRLTNIQAALGVAQMERIDEFLQHRRAVAEAYRHALAEVPGVRLPPEAPWAENIFWLYVVEIGHRDAVVRALSNCGIDSRPVFPPLPGQPAFGAQPSGRYPNAEAYAHAGLCLPLSNAIKPQDAMLICERLAWIMQNEVGTQASEEA